MYLPRRTAHGPGANLLKQKDLMGKLEDLMCKAEDLMCMLEDLMCKLEDLSTENGARHPLQPAKIRR